MTERIAFRQATRGDEPAVRALLASESLPVDDLSLDAQEYLVALSSGAIVGCVGLEACGDAGLFRSLAVAPARRGRGLGGALLGRMAAHARLRGVRIAYALTTTAEAYLVAHGFERIDRALVPPAVAALAQFRTLCPATAVCLRRRLGGVEPP